MSSNIEREEISTDILIVGAGPTGLSAAIHIKQLAQAKNLDISVTIIEKSAEIGGHIVSGAVLDISALNELLPDWKKRKAPITNLVKEDKFYLLSKKNSLLVPNFLLPPQMKRKESYIISLGEMCQWLAKIAEDLGVEIYPSTAAADLIINEDGSVGGVISSDLGLDKNGKPGEDYIAGILIRAKYCLIAEGARGSLAQKIIKKFQLDKNCSTQKYALGIKEIYQLPKEKLDRHQEGLIEHFLGFPLAGRANGGGFLYHAKGGQIYLGLITHLDYKNPTLSPFDEFNRFKSHPKIKQIINGLKPVSYGARAINSGGLQSIPKLAFKGGALIGCSAGFMNLVATKAIHLNMFSAMISAREVVKALEQNRANDILQDLQQKVLAKNIEKELKQVKNAKILWSKFGTFLGSILAFFDLWFISICKFSLFGTLQHKQADYLATKAKNKCKKLIYKKNNNDFILDKSSLVHLANISYNENQPNNLQIVDEQILTEEILPKYGAILPLLCPAGTYEIIKRNNKDILQINSANCLHCKSCDIKDPYQNIVWTTPEGGSGPNYSSM